MTKNRPGQGRKRKPTEQHLQDGTYREDRHGPAENHVTAPPGRPSCPAYVEDYDAGAKQMWEQSCDWLEAMGILAESDQSSIEAFVMAYIQYRQCLKLRGERHIEAWKDEQGRIRMMRSPLAVEVHKWLAEMHRYGAALGLSPTARASMIKNGPESQSHNRLEALFAEFNDLIPHEN